MTQRFFVTATGTDLGKTYVTAALVALARAKGRSVRAVKPLASGFEPDLPAASDAATLIAALGLDQGPDQADDTIAAVSPWRYRAPLSPDMAAAREGGTIDVPGLIRFSRDVLAGPEDLILIEGVGGVMVPLDGALTVRDWIAALGVETILVAGCYLGSLSHILTALEALVVRRIPVHAIVLSEGGAGGQAPVPLDEIVACIKRYWDLPVFIVQHRSGVQSWRQAVELAPLIL